MRTIGESDLWSFVDGQDQCIKTDNDTVRKQAGHFVSSFVELVRKVAELQFRNWNSVLLFRGQNANYENRAKSSSLKPALFRPLKNTRDNPSEETLKRRFERLKLSEARLSETYSALGASRIKAHRVLRWAILQHYDVCDTPLLDVTHSLRVAAAFATLKATSECYIYVLAIPNLSGAITANAEAGLQVIRLASICPPQALRPHIQQGYLLGEYPDLQDIEQTQLYNPHEIDFGKRLIGKFRFHPTQSDGFEPAGKLDLYPTETDDSLLEFSRQLLASLGPKPD